MYIFSSIKRVIKHIRNLHSSAPSASCNTVVVVSYGLVSNMILRALKNSSMPKFEEKRMKELIFIIFPHHSTAALARDIYITKSH